MYASSHNKKPPIEIGGFFLSFVAEKDTAWDFGVRINGDSMETVYHDGQIVWVEKTVALRPGEAGIFICNGEGYLKVFELCEPSEEELDDYVDSYGVLRSKAVLVSYNKQYSPKVVLTSDSFSVIGYVVSR